MGQVQSDEYNCDNEARQDVGDSELNTRNQTFQGEEINNKESGNEVGKCSTSKSITKGQQHVRKLSNVSHRNIQLLSMKPWSEKDAYADDLRTRRRSSLINLILGAPSSGPRFSEDLYSLGSACEFGIEIFQDIHQAIASNASLHFDSFEGALRDDLKNGALASKRRRSSLESLALQISRSSLSNDPRCSQKVLKEKASQQVENPFRKSNISSALASIDLTSSFEQHDKSGQSLTGQFYRPPLFQTKRPAIENISQDSVKNFKLRSTNGRVNSSAHKLRRSGSELSLYSSASGSSAYSQTANSGKAYYPSKETKLIIMLQVCLPFLLAGFGNMAAGLVLNHIAQWRSFHKVPTFFVLLPSFVGLKGNIEMNLASRLSTLSNLKLLDTKDQRLRAYTSNLVLILSQAIGLSTFATLVSILCEILMNGYNIDSSQLIEKLDSAMLIIWPTALATSIVLVVISSIVIYLAVALANLIQVNPDNLSTLVAALYGDVTCVWIYGLIGNLMFNFKEQNILTWPLTIVVFSLIAWPTFLYSASKLKETQGLAFCSLPPMLISIIVSICSGMVLSKFVDRFRLLALYQPVVNGFGANLIAVQASRVSTWLWCSALRKLSIQKRSLHARKLTFKSIATFSEPREVKQEEKLSVSDLVNGVKKMARTLLWSFFNSSPNAIAARFLLVMLIPAQTMYFFVIWLLAPLNYVVITWQFYSIYIGLCLLQVFILLSICEPLMTFIMRQNLDPDSYGISLLMAIADLTGTLCLTGAFSILTKMRDVNAIK